MSYRNISVQTKPRDNVDDLITKVLNDDGYKWMQNRIKSMEDEWKKAILSLGEKRALSDRSKQKVN